MEGTLGRLIAVTPLRRYVVLRTIGVALMALMLIGFIVLVCGIVSQGLTPMSLTTFVLGGLLFYFVSALGLSRRAKVYQNGVVPSFLPFAERFSWRTPILHKEDISEIRNRFAGRRIIGVVFETHNGKKYSVARSGVGDKVFYHFLQFKRRYYSTQGG